MSFFSSTSSWTSHLPAGLEFLDAEYLPLDAKALDTLPRNLQSLTLSVSNLSDESAKLLPASLKSLRLNCKGRDSDLSNEFYANLPQTLLSLKVPVAVRQRAEESPYVPVPD